MKKNQRSLERGILLNRRITLLTMGLITIVIGLSIRVFSDGAWTDPAGDGLYAILVYVAVAFLVPRKPRKLVALVAIAVCVAIELFQLTGIPAELRLFWSPLSLILGTTFGAADLIAYAGGAAFAYAIDSMGQRLRPRLESTRAPSERLQGRASESRSLTDTRGVSGSDPLA